MRVRGWISAVVFMTPQSRVLILSLMRVALLRLENFIANTHFLGVFFLAFSAGLIIVVMLHNQKIIIVLTNSLTHDVASSQSERVYNIF